MKAYKILHKPTGLFYTPSKGYGNLSTTGKVYHEKPSLSWIDGGVRVIVKDYKNKKLSKRLQIIVDYFNLPKNYGTEETYNIDEHINVLDNDWEIKEV
jgi:hypothetical protein